jgi:hypothetical protein
MRLMQMKHGLCASFDPYPAKAIVRGLKRCYQALSLRMESHDHLTDLAAVLKA